MIFHETAKQFERRAILVEVLRVGRSIARAVAVVLLQFVLLSLMLLTPHRSNAQEKSAAETCVSVNQNLSLGAKLPRIAGLLKARKPLRLSPSARHQPSDCG